MTVIRDPAGLDALSLAAQAAQATAPHVHICTDGERAEQLRALLAFFAPGVEIAVLPAWDCLPYDRVGPHADITAARVATLFDIAPWRESGKNKILLTTVNAALQRLPLPGSLSSTSRIARGNTIDIAALHAFFQAMGYARVPTVREPGEWAQRGGILDLFPPGAAPVRLDLFGDEVESLRAFDPMTQVSGEALEAVTLRPVAEFALDEASVARFRAGWRAAFGVGAGDAVYNAVSQGRRWAGAEHWLPLFHESMATLAELLPGAAVTRDPGADAAAHARLAQVAEFCGARKTLAEQGAPGAHHPLPPEALYLTQGEWDALAPPPTVDGAGTRAGPGFFRGEAREGGDLFDALKAHIRAQAGKRVLVAAYSPGALERLEGMLAHAEIGPRVRCAALGALEPARVGLAALPIELGFTTDDLAVITECDILGQRISRPAIARRRKDQAAAAFAAELSSLSPGDMVVHTDHGVGRFVALETLAVGKALHDCLRLEYAGGDRLFVPVANMDLLTRFGAGEGAATLDKLGGAGWQARKAAARRNVMEIAAELVATEAARQARAAQALAIDPQDYAAFAARFPYAETADQDRAITQVLEDLKGPQPMDRLVCGDVGFGKTEVAMRAAFVAARAGAQIAVVVPTTLLARQHFATFTQRFSGTGLRVEQLSRMVAPKRAAAVRAGISDGSVHIVIGTHALLSDTIRFSNLGLAVIDEEQHFGVKQKERLKALRTDVHALALSATPIPRTLHMALSAVRAMSVIATPPVDRLAIRSFVAPLDPVVVRDALLREHARGGQSFVVCPRVRDLPGLAETLADLVPELTVIAAHGQMPAKLLEERIGGFYDGRADILLATPIIESGLDVPRANTLIVHRADMFGLAQLYQIRGRVGRGAARAYAYLTYEGALSEPAAKRLAAMETLDSLGAGFELASHDLDIRGAGNLLGAQQSGQVREVGVELYQQMLSEALAAVREGGDAAPAEEAWSPQVRVGVSALLPESYVTDVGVRMGLYRRLADARQAQEREVLAAEIIDRFGHMPAEARALLCVLEIKALARRCGLEKVDAGAGGAVLTFRAGHMPTDPARVARWAAPAGAKLRPDGTIAVPGSWGIKDRLPAVRRVLGGLAEVLGSVKN